MRSRWALVIPAFNAEQTLPVLLHRLEERAMGGRILVVDDGSTDGTAECATAAGVQVVRHDDNLGKGAALMSGFREALKDPALEFVITMDADLQHDPEDLASFLKVRSETSASIIVGMRTKLGSGMPVLRILSNTLTSWLVSARTGHRVADSQCGYRLIGREILEVVSMESKGFEAETELLIRAARLGFGMQWVPIRTVYQGEASRMTHWATTRAFLQVLLKDY